MLAVSIAKRVRNCKTCLICYPKSNISFNGWDFKRTLGYHYIGSGKEYLKQIGLGRGRVSPKWLGHREDLIAVGGSKFKGDERWRDTKRVIR